MSAESERREVRTRELVAGLLARGLSSIEVARVLGVSKSTVCYHKRRLGHEIDAKFNRRYDWAEVQRYYDLGHTISECERRFGFARATFMDAAKRGDLITRPQRAPIETYLVVGRRTNRTHLKQRLLAEGLKENRCERCGIESWLGEPLSMALHMPELPCADPQLLGAQPQARPAHRGAGGLTPTVRFTARRNEPRTRSGGARVPST